jgi:hypothetical protein
MADNKTGGGPGDGGQPTLTEYKKSQARVRELVEKRRMLDRKLVRKIPTRQASCHFLEHRTERLTFATNRIR